jgi:hypothetical protein
LNFNLRFALGCCVFASIICSCNSGAEKIRNADSIHLFFPGQDSILEYRDSSQAVIDYFRKVLNGAVESRKCSTDGEIRFMMKDSILFLAGFSFKDPNCQYLMAGEKAWKLTYNAGQYLTGTFYQLKK